MNANEGAALRLTRLQRRVVRQSAEGRTRREIALMLGVTVQAVKKHLWRARKRAVTQKPALVRYARAISLNSKSVRIRPFTLLPTEHA